MPRFNILGPLEVSRGGRICTPSAPMQRALICLLLLHANEVLPATRIIEVLWDGRPPRSASAVLQMYIAGVRRALGTSRDTLLRTESTGYVLELKPEELDLAQFRVLATLGRRQRAAGKCARAGALFRAALRLWRGPALADLDRANVFEPYVVRLEEERFAVLQERISVDLCQGRGIEVVAELQELCARYPLTESLHQQLMLALHRTGRRADALTVYARIRRAMIGEVGLEPGQGLQAVQLAILRDSPTLSMVGHERAAWGGRGFRACDPKIFGGWE